MRWREQLGLLDAWARSHRNARGLGAALALLIAIITMLSLRCDPVVERSHLLGLVLEIQAEGVRPLDQGEPHTRVVVAVPDTTQTPIMLLPPPVPRTGDFIPLIAEVHKKGSTDYFLDIERWRTEGPQ